MSGHTPGPWLVVQYMDDLGVDAHGGSLVIASSIEGGDRSTAVANTFLVAAAPELLAALETVRDELEASGGFDGDEPLFARVVAAIRLAETGERS